MPKPPIYKDDVEKILDMEIVTKGTRVHKKYLVEWKAHLNKPNSVEFASNISAAMIKEFLKTGAKSSATRTGAKSSITQAAAQSSVTRPEADGRVKQSVASSVVTRASTRNPVIRRLATNKEDKSTQTGEHCFERFDYD